MEKQKTKMEYKVLKENAVTLVALIVAIIILLILAGISVVTLVGDNGIVSKAVLVKESSRGAEVNEKVLMASYENVLSGYPKESIRTKQNVIDELYEEELLTDEEKEILESTDLITIGNIEVDFSILNENSSGGSNTGNIEDLDKEGILAKITELENLIEENKCECETETMLTRIETLENDVSTLLTTNEEMDLEITNLSTKVKTLENTVSSMKSKTLINENTTCGELMNGVYIGKAIYNSSSMTPSWGQGIIIYYSNNYIKIIVVDDDTNVAYLWTVYCSNVNALVKNSLTVTALN